MMCTVQYRLLYYRGMKRIIMACFDEFGLFFHHPSLPLGDIAGGPKCVINYSAFVAPALTLVKAELSDVDDTASGTDWLMLNSQQYLMHCLQHRKKRHKVRLLLCSEKCASLVY